MRDRMHRALEIRSKRSKKDGVHGRPLGRSMQAFCIKPKKRTPSVDREISSMSISHTVSCSKLLVALTNACESGPAVPCFCCAAQSWDLSRGLSPVMGSSIQRAMFRPHIQ